MYQNQVTDLENLFVRRLVCCMFVISITRRKSLLYLFMDGLDRLCHVVVVNQGEPSEGKDTQWKMVIVG